MNQLNKIIFYIVIITGCGTNVIFVLKYVNTTFDAPKLALMFIGTSIGCICWAIKGFQNGIYGKTKGVNLAILIYLVSAVASMVFSYNWVISFFGGFKQCGGVLSLLIYLAFFYLSVNFINRRNIVILFRFLIAASVLICIYGILQYVGVAIFNSLPMYGRVYSTLGQPVFFGCFLAMMIPVVLYEIARTRKLYLYGVLLLLVYCLFIAQARSGLLATVFISVPLLFIYKNSRGFKITALVIFAAVFVAGIFIDCREHTAANLYARFIGGINYSPRFELYSEAFKAAMTFPVFGVGQDNVRPHNIFLGHFAKLGIIGLLSFCYLGLASIRSFFGIEKGEDHNLLYTLFAVCLIYLVFRQFNPAYMPVTLLFVMFAGAIYGVKNSGD